MSGDARAAEIARLRLEAADLLLGMREDQAIFHTKAVKLDRVRRKLRAIGGDRSSAARPKVRIRRQG